MRHPASQNASSGRFMSSDYPSSQNKLVSMKLQIQLGI